MPRISRRKLRAMFPGVSSSRVRSTLNVTQYVLGGIASLLPPQLHISLELAILGAEAALDKYQGCSDSSIRRRTALCFASRLGPLVITGPAAAAADRVRMSKNGRRIARRSPNFARDAVSVGIRPASLLALQITCGKHMNECSWADAASSPDVVVTAALESPLILQRLRERHYSRDQRRLLCRPASQDREAWEEARAF